MTGDEANKVARLTVAEAVRNRPQDIGTSLLRGVERLGKLPGSRRRRRVPEAPAGPGSDGPRSVSNLAWGHKYFSLMHPEKLDDYHNADYQRFHLVKMLQVPPEGDGRYLCAGRYVAAAHELGIPINHLTTILNHHNSMAARLLADRHVRRRAAEEPMAADAGRGVRGDRLVRPG